MIIASAMSLVELFLPSVLVLFWIDIMPYFVPVAQWAQDALLVSHAFLLRTTIVSWADTRPWVQAWIHYIIMAYFFILDASTFFVLIFTWSTQGIDLPYRCMMYAIFCRIVISLADCFAKNSKALFSAKGWAAFLLTLPWSVRVVPIYSMLHLPRKLIPYAHKNRPMYTLQESLQRKKALEWHTIFRTWIVIIWSVLNASLLSL